MPDKNAIQRDGEICAGGDIRKKGNKWLRDVYEKYEKGDFRRVPRLPEVIKVVRLLDMKKNLSRLAHLN